MKYLFNQLQETNGAYIDELVFLPNEFVKDFEKSDLIEKIEEMKPKEICQIFGLPEHKEVLLYIHDTLKEEDSIHSILSWGKRYGFIANVMFPVLINCTIENEQIVGCTYDCGLCHSEYIYGHTIGGLVNKIVKSSNRRERDIVKRDNLKKRKEKNEG